ELGGAVGEGDGAFGVALVVGVGLDGQLAGTAAAGGDDPQVGAALIDDPLAVAADAGAADAVVLVGGELLGRPEDGEAAGAALGLGQVLADEVGRRAVDLADVVQGAAVGGPHGRGVLA